MGKVPYFQIKVQNQLILRSYDDDTRRIIASGGSQAGRMFETAGLANVLRVSMQAWLIETVINIKMLLKI